MRLHEPAIPLARPRRRVVPAFVGRLLRSVGAARSAAARRRRLERLDLDQRVRETGEW